MIQNCAIRYRIEWHDDLESPTKELLNRQSPILLVTDGQGDPLLTALSTGSYIVTIQQWSDLDEVKDGLFAMLKSEPEMSLALMLQDQLEAHLLKNVHEVSGFAVLTRNEDENWILIQFPTEPFVSKN